MPHFIRASTPILKSVIIGAYVAGFGLAALGAVLVFLGSTGNTELSLFGQSMSSTSVGVPAVFIGGVTIVLLVRRVLKSVDSVMQGEFYAADSRRQDGRLEITHVRFTHESEFDITVRNKGKTALVINRIEITMLKDYKTMVLPILNPTAKYEIPVDGMKEGETRYLDVSHVVDARKADRFLVALDTTNIYELKVALRYNQGDVVSFVRRTWSDLA